MYLDLVEHATLAILLLLVVIFYHIADYWQNRSYFWEGKAKENFAKTIFENEQGRDD